MIFAICLLFSNLENDEYEKLIEYIDWFTWKILKLVNKFVTTKKILLKHNYRFEDLNKLSNIKFNNMNINKDIIYQIKLYIKKFLNIKIKRYI